MKYLKKYAPIHLDEEMPDTVVVVGGGNDLSSNNKSVPQIANEIIDVGIDAKMRGASKVVISSVLPRGDFHYQLNRHLLNKLLKDLCVANNFYFLNNNNIFLDSHLAYDKVHLNIDGTRLLADNLIGCLNNS